MAKRKASKKNRFLFILVFCHIESKISKRTIKAADSILDTRPRIKRLSIQTHEPKQNSALRVQYSRGIKTNEQDEFRGNR